MQRDAMMVRGKPSATVGAKVVTGAVVDDEEYFAAVASHQGFEEPEEGAPVEHVDKLVCKARVVQRNRSEQVRGLALATCCNAWLFANAGPGSMQRRIELEAGFVFEQDYSVGF